ncbi:MAG TPA: ATP cone domain-containing protein, partial [Ilumatobacteraceae bacterium]|nr:ATP cone domain-containing protein [Ilumatobacteraceae bacterium]
MSDDDATNDQENPTVTVIDDNAATTEPTLGAGAAPTLTDTAKAPVPTSGTQPSAGGMRVKKRSGALEPVDVNKIVNAIARACEGLLGVDPMRVATRTISALADGASTRELDDLSIRTAAGLIVEEPNYSRLASRLLATVIDKEVRNQNIPWFSESIAVGHAEG